MEEIGVVDPTLLLCPHSFLNNVKCLVTSKICNHHFPLALLTDT